MHTTSKYKGTEAQAGNWFAALVQVVKDGCSKEQRAECGEQSVSI